MPFLAILGVSAGTGLFNGILGKEAANNAASTQSDAEKQVLALINGQLPQANSLVSQGTTNANDTLSKYYQSNMALLAPYLTAGAGAEGELATDLAPGGQLNSQPTAAQIMAQDPGYQFRLQQGQQALERSAAAKGGASGGALESPRAIQPELCDERVSAGLPELQHPADESFQPTVFSSWNRAERDTNRSRRRTATGSAESGNITQGAGQQSNNILQALGLQSNAITGAADATASGYVGGANALTSGITNGVNTGIGGINSLPLQKLLAKPNPPPNGTYLDGGIP